MLAIQMAGYIPLQPGMQPMQQQPLPSAYSHAGRRYELVLILNRLISVHLSHCLDFDVSSNRDGLACVGLETR